MLQRRLLEQLQLRRAEVGFRAIEKGLYPALYERLPSAAGNLALINVAAVWDSDLFPRDPTRGPSVTTRTPRGKMTGSPIFLTGATGNAGQYVVAELMRRNIPVTALVRNPSSLPGCRTVLGELSTVDRLSSEIENACGIIHLACARTNETEKVLREDILGTGLLAFAWRSGPFIYSSSATIHGQPQSDLREDTPIAVRSWYEAGKFTNEFQLRLAEQPGSKGPCVRFRPGLLFAASDRRHNQQFLSSFHQHCQLGNTFIFDSEKGLETYGSSFIGGKDLGWAVAQSLSVKVAGAYNVASGFCTWRQLVETINRIAGTRSGFHVRPGAKPGAGEYRPPQSRTFLDVSAFAAQTAFAPQQNLEMLVEEFVRAERSGVVSNPGVQGVR